MPLKPTDTSKDTLKQSGPDVFDAKDKKGDKQNKEGMDANEDIDANIKSEPNQANYGFGQRAKLDTEAEETQEQEYSADGLTRMAKYSVDKSSKGMNESGGSEARGNTDV